MFEKQISFDQLLKHNKFVILTSNFHYFFFISLFLIQLSIFTDYGFSSDEEISRNNGLIAYNIKAIQEQQSIIALLHRQVMESNTAVASLQQQLLDEQTKTAYFEMKINQILSHLNI